MATSDPIAHDDEPRPNTDLFKLKADADAEDALVRIAELRARGAVAARRVLVNQRAIERLAERASRGGRLPKLTMAGATSLLAAAIPVATLVHGTYEKDRDLEIERERQIEHARMAYLDRTVDEVGRDRVLRFIMETSTDSTMTGWAQRERTLVEEEQTNLAEQIQEIESRIDSTATDAANKAAAQRISELETRLGRPTAVFPRAASAARPGDSPLPPTPPKTPKGAYVPEVAKTCERWSPNANFARGKCHIACWDAAQSERYNVDTIIDAVALSACESAALKRCKKVGNSFCGFEFLPLVPARDDVMERDDVEDEQ